MDLNKPIASKVTKPLFKRINGKVIVTQTQSKSTPKQTRNMGVQTSLNADKESCTSDPESDSGDIPSVFGLGRNLHLILTCGLVPQTFDAISQLMQPSIPLIDKISSDSRLTMFLMKLKHNTSFKQLAILHYIDRPSCIRIFVNTLVELTEKMSSVVTWPRDEAHLAANTPAFLIGDRHGNDRCRFVVDCTSIKLARSFYYPFKRLKFLIGMAPCGLIGYVSPCFKAKTSDLRMAQHCDVVGRSPEGLIVADRAFGGLCDRVKTVPTGDVEENVKLARLHVTLEKIVRRMKGFRILDEVPDELIPYADQIVLICAILTNLMV